MTFTASTPASTSAAQATDRLTKPVLKEGSSGSAVRELQQLLNNNVYGLKFNLTVDGQFGPRTTNAVSCFQYQVFLATDGIVGDRTWRALYQQAPVDMPTLKRGSVGSSVTLLQDLLTAKTGLAKRFYFGAIDGQYGSQTERAVADFQKSILAPVTGIVSADTWYQLSKYQRHPEPAC